VPLVGLNRLQVRPVHYTAEIDIVAKVAGSDRLAFIGLNLLLVRSVHDAIGVVPGLRQGNLDRKSGSTTKVAVHRTAEAIEVDRGYQKDPSYHECVGSPRSSRE